MTFSFPTRLRFSGQEDDITIPSKPKAKPHLGGDTGIAPSCCEAHGMEGRLPPWAPLAAAGVCQPHPGRWVRGRDGVGLGFSQFSMFSECKETTQQYFCLTEYRQNKRSISVLGKTLISCKVMHSELAAFLKQK